MGARGEAYDALLVERARSLLGVDGGVAVARWQFAAELRAVGVATDSETMGPLPAAEMLRRAEHFAPQYAGITGMFSAEPVRVSDVVPLRSFWGTERFELSFGHAGRFPAAAALSISQTELVFLGLHRQRSDFSDQDIADLAVLQRVISPALAYRAALDAAIAQLHRSIDHPPGDHLPGGRPEPEGWAVQVAVSNLCRDFRPTRREAEVLCLVTAGLTDRQIARRLGVKVPTVRKHLSQIFDKAGVRGRAAVAAWWQRTLDTEPAPKR